MNLNDILVIDYDSMRDKVKAIADSEDGKYFDSKKINRIINSCEQGYSIIDEMKDAIEIELDNFEARKKDDVPYNLDFVKEITAVFATEAGISYARNNEFGIDARGINMSKEGRIAAFIAAGYDVLDDEFRMPDTYDTWVNFTVEITEHGVDFRANVESDLGTESRTIALTEEQELELYDMVIKAAVKDKSNAYNLAHSYLHSIATYQDYEITEDTLFEHGLALVQYKDTEHEEVAMRYDIDLDNVLDALPIGYPIKNIDFEKKQTKSLNDIER